MKQASVKQHIDCTIHFADMLEAIGFQNRVIMIRYTLEQDRVLRRIVTQELRDEDDA
jgi:hypothetical protein